jgi:hypothetical protein
MAKKQQGAQPPPEQTPSQPASEREAKNLTAARDQAQVQEDQGKKPQGKENASPTDPFLYRTLFPSASNVVTYTAPRISILVADCIFVPDTNVLLAPYGFGGKNLDAIAHTYQELASNDRLLVAEWCIREFGRHRTDVLLSSYQTVQAKVSAAKSVEGFQCPMLEAIAEYGQIQNVVREINKLNESYKKLLGTMQDHLRDWSWDDKVSVLYRNLFPAKRIVKCAKTDGEVLKDLEYRNTHGVPPGYKDRAKSLNNIGDIVLWHTLLQIGAEKKTNVVLISNEEKHDWVYKTEKRVMLPRFELCYEFHEKTERHFGFINWIGFLELMVKDEDVIRQAEQIELSSSHKYMGIQKRINTVLSLLAGIAKEFLAADQLGTEYVFITEASFPSLVQEYYQIRSQYEELIHSPTGSRYLECMEEVLEEIESINSRLEYMQARLEGKGAEDERRLREACQAFLKLFDSYSSWYLAGAP